MGDPADKLLSALTRLEERWPVLALWPYLLILALGSALLFPRLGEFGLWDPWEPKYAQSAKEMLERGSYVVPYFLDEVRLTKPILTYWGVLAGYSIFGVNELGARFFGACMAVASMLGVLHAVRRMRGRRAALLSACVLGTTPQFLFLARQATPDIYLLTSFGCGIVFFAVALFGPRRGRMVHLAVAAAGLALAVLAKGPVIVGVLFGATLALYGVARLELRKASRLAFGLAAVALTLGLLGSLAFLFGTSPEWWGYSDESRAVVAGFHDRILTFVSRTSADGILLGLLGLGCGAAALHAMRKSGSSRKVAVRAWALGGAALTIVAVLLVAGTSGRILAASLLGMVAATWAGFWILGRLRQDPGISPQLRSSLRPLARPLLLFLGIFIGVAGPWHVAILIQQRSGYVTDFILKHNVTRFGEIASSTGSLDFYLGVLLHGFFPWSCLLPVGLVCLVRWWAPDALRRHGFEVFLLIAALVTLVAFGSAVTKFPYYLAPLVIPLALLFGLTLDRMLDRRWPAATLCWSVAALLYLPLMLDLTRGSGIELLVASFTVKQNVRGDLLPGPWFSVLLWTLAGLWILAIFFRSRWNVVAILAASVVLGGYLTVDFIPALSRDKTAKALCEVWKERGEPGEPIGLYGDVKFGAYFYTDRRIQLLDGLDAFLEFMRPERPAMCIVQRSLMSRGRRAYMATYPGHDLHVAERGHGTYATLANHPVDDDGVTRPGP